MTCLENHPRDKFLAGTQAAAVVDDVWDALVLQMQPIGTGLF